MHERANQKGEEKKEAGEIFEIIMTENFPKINVRQPNTLGEQLTG